ncbi:MAG: hypothetical protein ACKV19_13345 [Verrucomicrobiales bacterium]
MNWLRPLLVAGLAGVLVERPAAQVPVAQSFSMPTVYIVCGAPGDEEHHVVFEKRLAELRRWFIQRVGVPATDVSVYYGPASAGYAGTGTRANVERVCADAVARTKAGRPVWLIITGHANEAPGDVRFNLPGGDLSGKDLAGWLAGAGAGEGAGPLTLILATACSGRAVKHLAGPNRAVVAATTAAEGADETVFGDCLVEALASPQADANKDGTLTLTEILLATRSAVLSQYKSGGFILTEHAGLDADGDGRATQRPAENDATAASAPGHSLKLKASGPS